MTVEQLVSYFSKVGVQQHDADGDSDVGRYNRLVEVMLTIVQELRAREGDQRRALTQLYTHPDTQVRFMAAIHTLALFPDEGRRTLQRISDRNQYPQAIDAPMILDGLDDGSYVPN